ncbi:hypothetical protein CYY_000889 [Polysphondylium violaceum]|uniref:Vacuolar protein sorting-associated protein 13 family protein n=1 Tax=Polysphondylium violaceum TaxID=133409 RepID=A0A8J4Q0N5_9MYCE|nr:hypothetical protein CYY_000889 [Polysphondylium violaceum]
MVFEGLVSDVLSRVLGEYVKNLNKDQLKIGIFGGNVSLTNLELKEDALANLPINLPIQVKKGFLGKLDLKVPWKDLKSKPVIINIDCIYALAVPQTQSYKYDEEEEQKKEQALKKKKVENYEWLKSIKDAEENEIAAAKDDSFTNRLVTKIIDNLQIVINKVHIRFENRNELGKLYAVGLTLDKLSAQSTDDNWMPTFIDSSKTQMIKKLAVMDSFGLYIDENAESLEGLPTSEFSKVFTELIPTQASISLLRKYIIKPISSQLKLTINKSELIDKAIPKILVDCILSQITCTLSAPQYQTILNILNFTNEFLRDMKYLKYRPTVTVKQNAKAWWKYIGQATIDQIKQKRYQKSWAYMAERRKDRILYIALFKRSIPRVDWLTPLNKSEKSQLEQLDEKLSFEDIIFFRSLAYAEVKKETEKNKIRKQFLEEKRSERGFFTNLFSTAKKKEDEQSAPIVQLSTEERDELYKTIEYTEVVQSVEEPPDWVKVVANLDVKGFALQLAENDMVFIEALYSGLSLKFEQRNEGIKLQAGIKLFEVYDQFTKKTHFPKIIGAVAAKSTGSFASAIVDTRPPDKSIDLFVELNVDPLNVIVTKPLILKVVDFFHDPSIDLTNISTRAGNHIVNFTERAKVQLQDAIDQHKTLALSVNIQAPVIVVPENVTIEKSNVLIVDLGSFKVRSDLSNSIKGKVVGATTNEDDFYDKFNVSFEEIQVLLSDDIKGVLNSTDQKRLDSRSHIVEKFDIQLKIFSSIQQDSVTLTKLKVKGELPRLDLQVSDKKVKQLLALATALTADLPNSGSANNGSTSPQLASGASSPKSPSTTTSPTQSPPLRGANGAANNNVIDINAPTPSAQPKQQENLDILLKHKQLACEFVIRSISITLSNQHGNLVKVQFCHLSVQYDQRTFDSIGCVSLDSLDIEDCFTKNSLKKLATSNPKDLDKSSNQSSLVKLDFKQFNQNSPEYDKKDMVVNIEFHSFYLVLNPSTINQLMVLLKSLESSQPKQSLNSSIPRAASTVRRASEPANTSVNSNNNAVVANNNNPTSPNTITTTTTTVVNTGGNTRRRIIRTLRQVHVPKKKKPTEFVSLKFTAHIESLGVALNQDNDQMLGIFSINNFTTDVTMFKDTRMAISGSLGSILLEDCTPSYSLYKQVIVPMHQSDKMLEFKYETFLPNLSNYSGYDNAVSAHVKSIVLNANIAFLLNLQNYFLGGMLDPILNADKAAEGAPMITKSASMDMITDEINTSYATPSSKTVSLEQEQLLERLKNQQPVTVTKMKLDIQIDTPVFVVPQSPKSKNTIQMELGKVVISNTFAYHDINQLPIDNMTILLQDTNISINSDLTQSNFLEKLNIELNLTRFLVPNKSPEIEDLVINLSITHFAFYLDENQYKFFLIMSDSLSKEMANAQKQVESAKKLLSNNTEDKEKIALDEAKKRHQKQIDMQYFTESEVISKMGKATAKVNVFLKYVSFTITQKGEDIAHFIINGINVDLKNTDTNKMSFQVNMKSISLKDSRKDSRNLYKVLLENKISQEDIKPFIQLGYLRDNTLGDQYINITINDPHLFLSPTPLIMIADFFMNPLNAHNSAIKEEEDEFDIDDLERQLNDGEDSIINNNNNTTKDLVVNNDNGKSNSYEQQQQQQYDQYDDNNNMETDSTQEYSRHATITFKLDINPTITIVENETVAHTNCLKLKTKVKVYFKRDTNAIELSEVTVKDTKMNIYRPLASQDLDRSQGLRSIQILKSVDKIYVKYLKENFTSIQWKQEITATLSPVKLFFSYQDVSSVLKIVNNINQAMQLQRGNGTTSGNNSTNNTSSPNDVSHMASSTSSLGQSTTSLMNTSTSSFNRAPGGFPNSKTEEELYSNNEKLKFSCSNISILFINESPNIYLPVAEVYLTEIESNVQNWSTDLEAKTSMMIKGDYFNEFNMKFEPFIEDWSYNIDLKKSRHGKIRATFSATREIMNLNLSYSFIQSVHSALTIMKKIDRENNQNNLTYSPIPSHNNTTTTTTNSALSKHMNSSFSTTMMDDDNDGENASKFKSTKTEFHSHWLSNHTGERLRYTIPKISKEHVYELMADSKVIPLPVKQSKNRDSTIGDHTKIDLTLPNGSTIENLSLDSVGCTIYPISTTGNNIVCDIKLSEDGSKTLWIKSMQQFENNTSMALEFKFQENGPTCRIEKNSKFSLPLSVSHQFDRFWFKLENSPYWSELVDINTIHNALPDTTMSKLFKLTTADKASLFVAMVYDHRVDCKSLYYNTFSIHPPVQIENLLPYPFKLSIASSPNIQKVEIGVGSKIDVYSYAPGTALVGSIADLIPEFPEIKHTLISGDSSSPSIAKNFKLSHCNREVLLDIERVETVKGIRQLSFYCQYWLMNNSLVPLEVKISDHETLLLPSTQPATAEFGGDQPHPILYTSASMKIKVANNNSATSSPSSMSHKDDKKYTPSFPICTIGHSNAIQYFDGFKAYEFCYRVDFCSNPKFSLSKIVTFTPRYVLYNNLPYPVNIAQYFDEKVKNGNNNNSNNNSPSSSSSSLPSSITLKSNVKLLGEMRLEPGQYKPFHWAVVAENKKIAIQPITNDHDHWRWSGGFFIDSVCDMVVRCRNDEKPEHSSILAHINVKDKYGTLYVSMPLVTKDSPPYLIENDTQFRISVSQKDTEYTDYLNAGERMMYGWDEPSDDYLLQIAVEGKPVKKRIKANKIKATKFSFDKFEIYATISIEGPSRVILFSTSDKKYKSIKGWTENSKLVSSQNQSEYNFYIRLTGIGLSIIDKSPKELAYISLTDLFIQATQSNIENTLEVKLAEMQIDNQLVKTEFPVLLHTTKVGANEHQKNDFLHVSIIKSTINNIDHFRYFSTLIQEMTVEIEDHWLKEVLDFIESLPNFSDDGSGTSNTSSTVSQGSPTQSHLGASFSSSKSLASSTSSTGSDYKLNKLCPPATLEPPSSEDSLKMVYFAILLLNPIKINLTLALQPDGLLKSNHKILSSIEGLGFSLTKLDRAPITLQGLLMEHPFSSRSTIIEKIKSSYISQVLRQFYNILGSIDILGNPVGLFRNFGTGVHDFFVEPAQGLIKSPADFGKGLAKGTSSLVKNSVYGTFNTLSKITGTIGTGVANLSFDDQYLHERKIHQARKPKHIGEGLAMGGIGLGRGLFQGITGIITKPVEGAKKGGVGGFAKGLVQGVVGVAVKPATAVIDLTTKTTEGIRNTTNLQSQAERVRPPRAFNQDKVLRPYDPLESEGWFLLKTSHKGKHAMDNYVWHHVINSELTIILSDQRLLIIKNKKNILHSSFVYQIPYVNIKNVKMVPEEGILLELDPPMNLGLLDRDVKFKTIYVDNPAINMLLNMKLTHVLRTFIQEHPHVSK